MTVRFCPSTSPNRRSSSKNARQKRGPVSLTLATAPAGIMIAIRYCFAGACARAGPIAAARNTPVMKSRRLVKPTFPVAGRCGSQDCTFGASWATANRVPCGQDKARWHGSPISQQWRMTGIGATPLFTMPSAKVAFPPESRLPTRVPSDRRRPVSPRAAGAGQRDFLLRDRAAALEPVRPRSAGK
jgi:hypothetical protein